jgi:hypothetical protein
LCGSLAGGMPAAPFRELTLREFALTMTVPLRS